MTQQESLIISPTTHSVATIMDKLEHTLNEKNIKIFARIRHSEAASAVGLTMQDEEVMIFGNPQVGTNLMLENPMIGIELPLRIAAWHQGGTTYIGYPDIQKLGERYGIVQHKPVIDKIQLLMEQLVQSLI